jgi:hypothetical protein
MLGRWLSAGLYSAPRTPVSDGISFNEVLKMQRSAENPAKTVL